MKAGGRSSGQPTADGGWRGVCSDITRSRDAEARIAYVTEYDSLTDLPNRAMLVRQLEIAQEAVETRGESFALFVIDLDNFKTLNDTQGHPAGDAYLKVVAERLRDCVGDTPSSRASAATSSPCCSAISWPRKPANSPTSSSMRCSRPSFSTAGNPRRRQRRRRHRADNGTIRPS